ncbi:MAG: TetR/AcrR family transcriptional regulator [Solirubrobacteraceae bacterium]
MPIRLDDESATLWDPELDEVVRALLNSAVHCFASHGYHATTTRAISTGAGLSPAAMYVHFGSKELILHHIVLAAHRHALSEISDPLVRGAPTAAESLRLLMSRYTSWHARHHIAARVAQFELTALRSEHYEQIVRLRRDTNDIFRSAVERGVADGTFAPIDVIRIVRGMLSLSIDLVRWYRFDDRDTPEQLGSLYGELALKMVLR